MQKRLAVKAHLSLEEIENTYRKAKDPVARSRLPDRMAACGSSKTTKQIVEYSGYGLTWIRTIAHRYNDQGPQADGATGAIAILVRQRSCPLNRSSSCGRRCSLLLPIKACGQAEKWLLGESDKTGRQVHPQRGWEYLRRLGGTLRVPRPRHAKADLAEQDARRSSRYNKPSLWRRWNCGHLMSTVLDSNPFFVGSGCSTGNVRLWSCLIALDGIKASRSPFLRVLHLLFLPPYSPELQPAEHLWPLSNEPLVNRHFHDLDELEEVQAERSSGLTGLP